MIVYPRFFGDLYQFQSIHIVLASNTREKIVVLNVEIYTKTKVVCVQHCEQKIQQLRTSVLHKIEGD